MNEHANCACATKQKATSAAGAQVPDDRCCGQVTEGPTCEAGTCVKH